MLSTNYGALVPEDELLTHQIVDTFATVSQSDPSWTEKIWTIAHARDNSLQVALGQWVGDERIEGNHVADTDKPENARKLHQLRDLLVHVDDPVGGGTGFGNAETFALGAFPERGLTAENSFL